MDIIQLLSAAGLGGIVGSLLTTVVQSWLAHKSYIANRRFQEKKEAYVGLLDSYHKAAVKNSNEAAKEFAFWQMRCELVAPDKVRKAIQEIVDSNEDTQRRQVDHEKLKEVLRKDLGVQLTN